jgi:hypothetical protein
VLLPSGRGPVLLRHQPAGLRATDLYGNPVPTPYALGGGLLYLSAPGLTLAHAAELLSEQEPLSFPTPAPATVPEVKPAPESTGPTPVLFVLIALGLLAGIWFQFAANRPKKRS